MKTQLDIKVVGSGLNFSPPGVDIQYGYNMIPYASVELTPEHLKMLCEIEKFRRKPVTISVQTEKDCLRFDGLIDGLSMQQHLGSISWRLIIKNRFQVLAEVYPRLPGLHPSSQTPFYRNEVTTVSPDPTSYLDRLKMGEILRPDMSKNVIEFLVQAMKMFVANQQHISLFSDSHKDAYNIIKLAKELSTTTLPLAAEMLEKINTAYVAGMVLTAADYATASVILQELVDVQGSLLSVLINAAGTFGCAVVFGNDSAYLVPEAGYLKQKHTLPVPSAPSLFPNVVYPSQYEHIAFDDNGYKDVKAVFVMSDQNATYLNSKSKIELGSYVDPDPNVTGGVVSIYLPKPVAISASGAYFTGMYEAHKAAKEGVEDLVDVLSAEEIAEEIKKVEEEFQLKIIDTQRRFINNWAQLQYLQIKFTDRTGSISTFFNPNFAPAAGGTVYTRYPGMYMDFFVTGVTHSFSVHAPSDGSARTLIRFNCARMGSSQSGQGLDKVDLYDYSSDTAALYAASFVNDITNKFE
jgi:hypothetical protein